jgi:hypothetical protein
MANSSAHPAAAIGRQGLPVVGAAAQAHQAALVGIGWSRWSRIAFLAIGPVQDAALNHCGRWLASDELTVMDVATRRQRFHDGRRQPEEDL